MPEIIKKKYLLPSLLISATLFFLATFYVFTRPGYLTFSDGAKFADVARNLVNGNGYQLNFSFFGQKVFEKIDNHYFPARGVYPTMPYSTAVFYKIFGVSDFSVIATSSFFFLLLVLTVFFLGKKLYGNLVGVLASLAVLVNVNFLDYATSGASEILLAFLVVLAAYLIILQERKYDLLALLSFIAIYFTRPQAIIFIAASVFLWLVLKYSLKRAVWVSLLGFLAVYAFDKMVLYRLSLRYPTISPVFARGLQVIFQYPAGVTISDELRGVILLPKLGLAEIFKKGFYNLYNFYRALPSIGSPYMWGLFIISVFQWEKDKVRNSLKLSTLLSVVALFIVVALTIPFYRYLHPVVPLIYLFATATLVWIVRKMVKKRLVAIVSTLLIVFFVVGQTLGVIFLDSRFKAARTNRGKPPAYVKLSHILRDNTKPEDIVITNLDTWGSWYGERKTVWFPLEPNQLIPPQGQENLFDAIYLTNYLMDDENYYMGDEWRQVFYSPERPEDRFIAENFELKGIYEVSAEETYEGQDARAVLLVRKED